MFYWFFFGILYLVVLTYQDYTRNMKIDDRHNYFMTGLTMPLFRFYPVSIWYILAIIVVAVIFNIFIKKFAVMGQGDRHSLFWIFLGFSAFGVEYIIMFFIIFAVVFVLHWCGSQAFMKFYKIQKVLKIQGYPIILISFCFNTFIYYLKTNF